MSLLQETRLTRDQDLRDRVEAAMARAADDIISESPDTPHHEQRMGLVRTFYGAIESDRVPYITSMVRRVVRNPSILAAAIDDDGIDQSAIPDGDIQFVVNSEWDRIAGVELGSGGWSSVEEGG